MRTPLKQQTPYLAAPNLEEAKGQVLWVTSGSPVWGCLGSRVEGLGFRGLGFRGLGVSGLGVEGLGFRVEGSGF